MRTSIVPSVVYAASVALIVASVGHIWTSIWYGVLAAGILLTAQAITAELANAIRETIK